MSFPARAMMHSIQWPHSVVFWVTEYLCRESGCMLAFFPGTGRAPLVLVGHQHESCDWLTISSLSPLQYVCLSVAALPLPTQSPLPQFHICTLFMNWVWLLRRFPSRVSVDALPGILSFLPQGSLHPLLPANLIFSQHSNYCLLKPSAVIFIISSWYSRIK